ncbi:GNAT family N-acetyltransferase [Flavobacterium sp. NG2]|uniref:GNAT family N-acetyltransferase n=1 Tax=Flavobacterium sp. NG2 TaxID=3097547 RepID=UPI002A804600|nr:GNAT family N-acetyltransferase [Flavobacterium sp. NG2]WPR71746.1 GNAT family N-acetyltransferase [Flavobacterium sp. NG2]
MTATINMDADNRRGAFEIVIDKKVVAKMTFVFAGPAKFIIDHTEVNPEYNGKGFGKILIQKAIGFAKDKNSKIIPLCPFAKAYFEKHPELNNVLVS